MKNILVTGANGQLGNEMRVLSAEYKEYTCFFTDVAELDICDEQAVMTFVKENNIHAVFHYLSLHNSEYYQAKHDGRVLINSDKFTECLVRLPLFYELNTSDVLKIFEVASKN